jgi:hypothetical protein
VFAYDSLKRKKQRRGGQVTALRGRKAKVGRGERLERGEDCE